MRKAVLFLLFLGVSLTLFGQSKKNRDAIKVGYAQAYITSASAFEPSFYLEYTRVFYESFSVGISAGYAKANDIVTLTEYQDLETFNFDFNAYYAALNTDNSKLSLGFGISARVFKTNWVVRATEVSGQDNVLQPGFSVILNYDYYFDPFLIGFRASVHPYGNNGSFLLIGGHLGFRF